MPSDPLSDANDVGWVDLGPPLRITIHPKAPIQSPSNIPLIPGAGYDDWVTRNDPLDGTSNSDDWFVPGKGTEGGSDPDDWFVPVPAPSETGNQQWIAKPPVADAGDTFPTPSRPVAPDTPFLAGERFGPTAWQPQNLLPVSPTFSSERPFASPTPPGAGPSLIAGTSAALPIGSSSNAFSNGTPGRLSDNGPERQSASITIPSLSGLGTNGTSFAGRFAPQAARPAQSAPAAQAFRSAPTNPGFLNTMLEAGRRGIVEGTNDSRESLETIGRAWNGEQAFRDDQSDTSANASRSEMNADYVGRLLRQTPSEGWTNLDWWAAQIAFDGGKNYPSAALGLAGMALGSEIAPGPGTAVLGAIGYGLGALIQTLAPACQRARAEGLSHDAAVDRALEETGIAVAFGAIAGAVPNVGLFGKSLAWISHTILA